MKKQIAAILMMMLLATIWLPALADTVTVTYSIFDAIIPFKNMVDCQRTTYTTVGKMQQLNGFTYVFSAKHDKQIHQLVPGVLTNPDDYYYKFSERNNKIDLTMYQYSNSSFSYVLSTGGYIQTYGDNCFIYAAVGQYNTYGSFVSFRDKEYHMCPSGHTHNTNKYPHAQQNQLDSGRKNCILCGCGETFIIKGYNPSIAELKTLPMVEGLVEIEHKHSYDPETGRCPCGEINVISHTVIFKDWDGREIDSKTVNHGSAATAPAIRSRAGIRRLTMSRVI